VQNITLCTLNFTLEPDFPIEIFHAGTVYPLYPSEKN
jgi:hypothetical protein